MGKHVAQDTENSRSDESIGYLVLESGTFDINGIQLTATVSADNIFGVDNNASGYSLPIFETPGASTVVLSTAGMDGNDGGWPVLFGDAAVNDTSVQVAIDEDQVLDSETQPYDRTGSRSDPFRAGEPGA